MSGEGCYVIRVSPDGYADPDIGPSGPFTIDEATRRADCTPDPHSGWRDLIVAPVRAEAVTDMASAGHDQRCLYCEHGPYCLTCPPPASIPDDAYVCGPCREEITRSEIGADPYYRNGAIFGDGA